MQCGNQGGHCGGGQGGAGHVGSHGRVVPGHPGNRTASLAQVARPKCVGHHGCEVHPVNLRKKPARTIMHARAPWTRAPAQMYRVPRMGVGSRRRTAGPAYRSRVAGHGIRMAEERPGWRGGASAIGYGAVFTMQFRAARAVRHAACRRHRPTEPGRQLHTLFTIFMEPLRLRWRQSTVCSVREASRASQAPFAALADTSAQRNPLNHAGHRSLYPRLAAQLSGHRTRRMSPVGLLQRGQIMKTETISKLLETSRRYLGIERRQPARDPKPPQRPREMQRGARAHRSERRTAPPPLHAGLDWRG